MPVRFRFAYFLGVCVFFSALFAAYTGLYTGWLDDTLMANLMAGVYEPKHVINPDYFIGISTLLIALYKSAPLVPWYGLFLLLLFGMAYGNLAFVLYRTLLLFQSLNFWSYLVAATVFSCLIQEYIMRNTFTTAACLLVGSGALLLLFNTKPKIVLYAGLCILLGLLTRLEITAVILFFISCLLVAALWFKNRKAIFSRLLPVVLAPVLVVVLLRLTLPTVEMLDFGEFSFYESLVQDAYIFPQSADFKDPATRLKFEAITTWNQFDADIITQDWLHTLYKNEKLTGAGLTQLLHFKLAKLLYFANRYTGSQSCFNWLWKEGLLLLINFALILLLGPYLLGARKTILLFGLWTLAIIIILVVAVLAKMEDRLLGPYLIFVTVFNVYALAAWSRKAWRAIHLAVLLAPLLCFSFYRAYECSSMSALLKADKNYKQKFVAELNSFNNKLILFDLYTAYFVDEGPYTVPRLNEANQYALPFHYAARHFKSNKRYWVNTCGSDNPDAVLNCLSARGDSVIFAYQDFDMDFLKRWNEYFYKDTFNFVPLNGKTVLTNYKSPLFWDNQQYNYYIIKNSPNLPSN